MNTYELERIYEDLYKKLELGDYTYIKRKELMKKALINAYDLGREDVYHEDVYHKEKHNDR